VHVVNLHTGASASADTWNGEPFVLTGTGAVAWIAGAGTGPRTVFALFQGVVTEQAKGAIQDDSLEASHSRVSWMVDGQIRSAFFG
jgi:hypothetical protein